MMLNKAIKILSTTAITLGLAILSANAAYAVDAFEVPTGAQVVGGAASFSNPSAGILNVTQQTDRAVINWDTFNIGEQATTKFIQPNSGSLAVNRVTGSGVDGSQILGSLQSNGRVMVLDRNGVFFGQNARIDVGSIIAATGDVDNSAIMNGANKFDISNFGNGKVVNKGMINVADAGIAAFVSPTIVNSGIINAKVGKVGMGAGSKVTLDLYGDSLLEIAVNDKTANALIEHTGTINAQGGTVMMTAQAAKDAVDNVINMNGVVNATSFSQQGGKIVLSGGEKGMVNVKGTMDVSGDHSGNISVTGQNIMIDTDAYMFADGGTTGNGGNVIIVGDNATLFRGHISAQGGTQEGNGGFVEVSGLKWLGYKGHVTTLAAHGIDGMLFLDPADIVIKDGTGDGAADGTLTFAGAALAGTIAAANVGPSVIWESELEGILATTSISVAATNSIIFENLTDNTLSLKQTTPRTVAFTAGAGGITMQDTNDTISTVSSAMTFTTSAGGNIALGNLASTAGAMTLTAAGGGNITAANLANTTAAMTFTTTGGGGITLGNLVKTSGLVTVNTSGNSQITGVLNGTGGLTKAGTGKLTLSGTNTYTGITTLTGGTLSVATIGDGGVAGNLGQATSAAANLAIGGGTTLEYTGATASTNRNFSLGATATISVTDSNANLTLNGASTASTAGLNKNGAGTLTLNAVNLYTGITTINGGTLKYGINNAINGATQGAFVVNDGGTFDLNDNSDTIGALTVNSGVTGGTVKTGAGTLTLGGNVTSTGGANNATIQGNLALGATRSFTTTNAADGLIISAIISGVGFGVTKSGAGKLTLSGVNTYTGPNSVAVGTLRAEGNANALGNGATIGLSGGTLQLASDTDLTFNVGTTNVSAASTVSSDRLTAGAGVKQTLGALTQATLTLNGTVGSNVTSGTGTVAFGATTLGNATFSPGANARIDLGALSDGGVTARTITKTGTGTLGLMATAAQWALANTLTINNGTLEIGANNAVGAGNTTSVNVISNTANTTALFQVANATQGINNLTLGGTGGTTTSTNNVATTGTGVLTLGGALTYTVTGNPLTSTISGKLDLGGGTRTLTINNSTTVVNDVVISADISNGNISKAGTGTLVLTGTNTHTNTALTAGTLRAQSNAGALGTGTVTLSAGTLELANDTDLPFTLTGVTVAGAAAITSDRLTEGAGVKHTLGTLSINGSTLTVNAGTNVTSGTGTIAFGATTLTGNPTLAVNANAQLNVGALDDGNAVRTLTKTGTGTLNFTAGPANWAQANNVVINNGVAKLSQSMVFGTGTTTNLTINANGANQTVEFDQGTSYLNINNLTFGGTGGTSTSVNRLKTGIGMTLGGTLTYTTTGNPTTTATISGGSFHLTPGSHTFTINDSSGSDVDLTINAALSGGGAISKAGNGTLRFAQPYSTFSGDVSVGAGVVEIGNTNVFGTTGTVSLAGGTIRGDGTPRTLSNDVRLTGSSTVNGSSAFTFGGSFTNTGAFTLTNNNTSTVSIGDILLSDSTTNRTLIISGSGNTNVTGAIGNFLSTTSNLTKSGTGTLTLSGNSAFTGALTVTAGTLAAASTLALPINGTVTASGGILNIGTQAVSTGAVTISGGEITGTTGTLTGTSYSMTTGTLSARLAGSGAFTKGTGAGTISSDNASYNGTFTLNSSTAVLTVANNNALGGGTFVLTSGTVQGDGTARTIANNATITGATTIGGSSALSFTGNWTNTATTTLTINNAANTTFNTIVLSNGVGNRTLTFASNGNTFVNGAISNGPSPASGITKTGLGTLTLSGANTYLGATTINGGVLSANTLANGGSASSIGASSNAAANLVIGGGMLTYTGSTVSTNRNFTLTTGTNGTINVSDSNANLTLSGASTATTAGLVKHGTGTLTLSGANLYTGTTTVNQGTLVHGVNNALATGALVVENGATWNLNGFTESLASVTSNGNGIVTLGTGNSLTTIGAQSYSGRVTGGTVSLLGTSITANNSTNDFTGTLTLTSGGAISVVDQNNLALGAVTSLTTTARAAGGNLTLNGIVSATSNGTNTIQLSTSGNFINNAGSLALTTPGNWLVYSTNPANDILGGLTSNYRRFSCTFGGSCPTLGTGNGFLYSITPVLTATAATTNVTYGNAVNLNNYAYTLSGYLSTDAGTDNVTGALNGTTAYTTTSNVGNYNIDYDNGALASAMGYGFTYANSTTALTVTQRGLTVTADAQTKTYGNADPTLTYATNSGANVGLVNGDTLSGALTRANLGTLAGEQVGTFGITQGTLAASGNYSLNYTGNDLSIGQKTLNITADSLSKTYGSADPALTYTANGLVNTVVNGVTLNDSITGTLARIAGEDVNTYAINQGSVSASGNYNIAFTQGALGILGKLVTLSGLAANNKPYDGLTSAILNTSGINLQGILTGDDVTLTGGTATFVDQHIGSGKTVNISGFALGGTKSGNYTLSFPTALTADITAPTVFNQNNNATNVPFITIQTSGLKIASSGGSTASQMANISPAAGDSSPEALANISPAAGGDDSFGSDTTDESAACWQQAAAAAGLSFGSGMGDTLSTVGCQ